MGTEILPVQRTENVSASMPAAGEPVPLALRELYLIRNFLKAASGYEPEPWQGWPSSLGAHTIA